MLNYLFVAIGGGVGAMSRFALGQWLARDAAALPLGTLFANVAGCFVIGMLSQSVSLTHSAPLRALLIVGFCGGFTTMSALVFDANRLLRAATIWQAGIYVVATLALCFAAFAVGALIGRALYRG